MEVKIRKLKVEDALVSWKWRNDPEIWKLTGRNWNNYVTKDIEEEWLRNILNEKNSVRFAICIGNDHQYIGNVQLTDITESEGNFHIFIGEKEFWGKGIAKIATRLVIDYAFNILNLKKVILNVDKNCIAAIKIYEKVGFRIIKTNMGSTYQMLLENEK